MTLFRARRTRKCHFPLRSKFSNPKNRFLLGYRDSTMTTSFPNQKVRRSIVSLWKSETPTSPLRGKQQNERKSISKVLGNRNSTVSTSFPTKRQGEDWLHYKNLRYPFCLSVKTATTWRSKFSKWISLMGNRLNLVSQLSSGEDWLRYEIR